MNSLSSVIVEIENELQMVYLSEAIRFMDENFDGAWSKAIDRFDLALTQACKTNHLDLAQIEGQIYKETLLQLIAVYKSKICNKEVYSFFEEMEKK